MKRTGHHGANSGDDAQPAQGREICLHEVKEHAPTGDTLLETDVSPDKALDNHSWWHCTHTKRDTPQREGGHERRWKYPPEKRGSMLQQVSPIYRCVDIYDGGKETSQETDNNDADDLEDPTGIKVPFDLSITARLVSKKLSDVHVTPPVKRIAIANLQQKTSIGQWGVPHHALLSDDAT